MSHWEDPNPNRDRRRSDGPLGALLAVLIALAGAMLLAHWSACADGDFKCLWTQGESA